MSNLHAPKMLALSSTGGPVQNFEEKRLSTNFVPETFAEMYSHYYKFTVRLVRSMGIDAQNAEDVAQTILTKFFEKDVLSQYDPDFEGRDKRKVLFRTLLSGFVASYVRHHRDMQNLNAKRDLTYIDQSVQGEHATYSWSDLFCAPYEEDFDGALEARELIRQIRARLVAKGRNNAQDRSDLPVLFDQIVEQTEVNGKIDVKALAENFGASRQTIESWIRRIRVEVTVVVETR